MLAQRYIAEIAAFPQATQSKEAKLSCSKSSYLSFEDALGKALEKPGMKAFKEVCRNSGNVTKAPVMTGDIEIKNDDIPADTEESNEMSEAIIKNAAQALGMGLDDLKKLLDLSGITAEDLTDAGRAGEIAEKLAVLSGLDKNEQQALEDILKKVAGSLTRQTSSNRNVAFDEPGTGASVNATNNIKDKSGWVSFGVKDMHIIVEPYNDLAKLSGKLKTKLLDAIHGLDKNLYTAENSELSESALTSIYQEDNELETIPSHQKEENELSKEKLIDDFSKEANNSNSDTQQENGWAENFMNESETAFKDSENADSVKNIGHEAINMSNIVHSDQPVISKANEAAKQQSDVNIPKNEIISQVVERAKVVLTGEKSEMIVDLKPDSLGKLSLKIVTEHGIVTAKFMAESHQVKQVLEANMQILKDSLEKQGMTVQNLSVSVGQQSSEGFDGDRSRGGDRRTAFSRMRAIAQPGEFLVDIHAAASTINPYNWVGSKINITA
jgi:flagellar hook-length control protein FliK